VSFRCVLILVVMLAGEPLRAQGHAPAEAPDTILFNGRVFTGNASRPYAESLSIKGGRILALGANQEVLSSAGPANTTNRSSWAPSDPWNQ
jgi:hypothetical protein